MWNDIVKFLTVAVVIHILFYIVDDYGNFFNEAVLKVFLYITLGFLTYHLVVNKLIQKYLLPQTNNKDIVPNKQKKPKSILKKDNNTNKKKKKKKVQFNL